MKTENKELKRFMKMSDQCMLDIEERLKNAYPMHMLIQHGNEICQSYWKKRERMSTKKEKK